MPDGRRRRSAVRVGGGDLRTGALSIHCMHMQLLSNLNSSRITHACTPHQTSTPITISHLLVAVHEYMRRRTDSRLFPESVPTKNGAVSLEPISGVRVLKERSSFTTLKPWPHTYARSLGPNVQRHMAYYLDLLAMRSLSRSQEVQVGHVPALPPRLVPRPSSLVPVALRIQDCIC
jgi:hypothetical protein